jgi:hypothetical protein
MNGNLANVTVEVVTDAAADRVILNIALDEIEK